MPWSSYQGIAKETLKHQQVRGNYPFDKYKNRARNLLHEGLIRGHITRQPNCTDCGKECFTNAHHPDYDFPFVVIWLCPSCHQTRHYRQKIIALKFFGDALDQKLVTLNNLLNDKITIIIPAI